MAAALIAAAWLGGCAPINGQPPNAGSAASPPGAAEPLAGPVALAPDITGPPPPSPAAVARAVLPAETAEPNAAAIAAALGVPVKALNATPASPPAAALATAVAPPPEAAPPAPCPPGSAGVWTPPDAAGVPVFVCRPMHPVR